MGAIRLKTVDVESRRRKIGRMLKPLHANQLVPCDVTHDKSGNGIVLAAHDGRGSVSVHTSKYWHQTSFASLRKCQLR